MIDEKIKLAFIYDECLSLEELRIADKQLATFKKNPSFFDILKKVNKLRQYAYNRIFIKDIQQNVWRLAD